MDRGPEMSVRHTNPHRFAANPFAAAVCYVVTVMLYLRYKPVSPTGSLVTALLSFAALTIGVLGDLGVVRFPLNTLVLFGAYCIGLGWLTYVRPPLSKRLGAPAMAPGVVGEAALTLWLLAAGVDPDPWRAQSTQRKA